MNVAKLSVVSSRAGQACRLCLHDLALEAIVAHNSFSILHTAMAAQYGMWGCKAMLQACR
jgi:hypothetical protein